MGDSSLQINFEPEISIPVNRKVRALLSLVQRYPIDGIVEFVPSYCTLTVHYRPEYISYAELSEKIITRAGSLHGVEEAAGSSEEIIEVPILYGGELGPDLPGVAEAQKSSEQEIIDMHTRNLSYIYLLGFAPGHANSARDRDHFKVQRKKTPTLSIPPRSIVVIEGRTDTIPFEQPTGWHVIGSTPLLMTDIRKQDPFLFKAGQWMKFIVVEQREYDEIKKQSDAGVYQPKVYPKRENT
jgi:KipI family sensor histidine kinase inhibitor